jgi:hypothetical protein
MILNSGSSSERQEAGPGKMKLRPKKKTGSREWLPVFSLFLTPWLTRYAGLPAVRTARAVCFSLRQMRARWSHTPSRLHTLFLLPAVRNCKGFRIAQCVAGGEGVATLQQPQTRRGKSLQLMVRLLFRYG